MSDKITSARQTVNDIKNLVASAEILGVTIYDYEPNLQSQLDDLEQMMAAAENTGDEPLAQKTQKRALELYDRIR